jgi:probable phosphoglycerate mutase
MPTIILIRHGETHWNRQGRIQGVLDSPLTLKGIAQAQQAGRVLSGMVGSAEDWRLVSSPLARCVQTTAIIAETAGLDFAAAAYDPRLQEIHTGAFSGRLKRELATERPDLMAGNGRDHWLFQGEGGEDWDALSGRLRAWLHQFQPGDRVIAVSHGIAGRMLRGLYLGLDPTATMEGGSPQDALFVLKQGEVRLVAYA